MPPPRALGRTRDPPLGAPRTRRVEPKEVGVEPVRAVLFDLDGVLVDSYEAWYRVVNAAARHFRKPDVDRDRFQRSWGQGTEADLAQFFPGCTLQQVEAYYEQHLLDHSAEIRVTADAHETLSRLRIAEVARGVVTNTPTALARDLLALVGLIGFIDVTVGVGPGIVSKPAPDTVLRACEALQSQPADTLFVGDSPFDEKAAKAARVPFVGYRYDSSKSVQRLVDVVPLVVPRASG
jgi:HAD superfamily hydrolase (TIGR01509 family)